MPKPTLRELSRQASRRRIADVALELFDEHGYDATTVEEIAAAAGISERTFFRYFATKDEAFFSTATEDTATVVELVRSRPGTEAPWNALQYAVEQLLGELDQDAEYERSRRYRAILAGSADLTAHQFARMSDSQDRIGEALWERWSAAQQREILDAEAADMRVVLRALVGSMLGVLSEVIMHTEDRTPEGRMTLVRSTFDAIRPGRADIGGAASPSR
ncbi:TetR/AcrR family transcriptional regulator [Leucobacter aridicollis]|uniref:AcrR family transcriptional regulator n=1 Tax=Leucobacter aridicollis TaxID=283878 RepID=A0A852R249_9MICO|nr:TetR/AcrR family transcriptional regulator [Leucobacter aridicollis]NYD27681.1 AcrR family transcriptional regulator [Leucobacter aridicollis]